MVDVDGDDHLELLSPSSASTCGFVVVRGERQRLASTPPPATSFPRLVVCDWNGDGSPDVLTIRRGQPPVLWQNFGDGRFYRNSAFSDHFSVPVRSAQLADFCNSGYPGIAAWTDSVTLVILERPDADGYDLSYLQVPQRGSLSLRDANGDGRIDVVVGRVAWLRTATGWDRRWTALNRLPATRTSRLRLVGTGANPASAGAAIIVATPVGPQTHWLYPPGSETTALVVPDGDTGVIIRWPGGGYSLLAGRLPTGETTLRVGHPEAQVVAEWFNEEVGSHLRWRLSSPVNGDDRQFWSVVCTGRISEPEPVRFDLTGQLIDWGADRLLGPGERCILSYAGGPVSVWTRPSPAVTLQPWPVAHESLPEAVDVVPVDGTGDGRTDLVLGGSRLDGSEITVRSLSRALGASGLRSTFDRARFGHLAWWHIVRSALPPQPATAAIGDRGVSWAGDAPPNAVEGRRLIVADVTGDGRLDALVRSPDGAVDVYQGTDGRPSGLHLASGGIEVGPVGPREHATITLSNPTGGDIVIADLRASERLILPDLSLPTRIPAGGRLSLVVRIPPGQHSAYATELVATSDQLDDGRASIPVSITIGVPDTAAVLERVVDLGVVQTDSAVRGSVSVPWVRLSPPENRLATLSSAGARATIARAAADEDTVRLQVSFTALAVGPVRLVYPLRRGGVAIVATAVDTIAPPAARPVATVMRDSVVIRWPAVEALDLDHYEIARRGGGTTHLWQLGLDTRWADTTLAEGDEWEYTVYAVDGVGNRRAGETLHVRRPDRTPPQVTLVDPPANGTDVDLRQPIILVVSDTLSGILAEGIQLSIDGVAVPRASLVLEPGSRRCRLTYRPTTWPLGATVRVRVTASDMAEPPNTARWVGQFTTVADTVVPVVQWSGAPPALGRGGVVRANVSLPPDRQLVTATLVVRPAGGVATYQLPGSIVDRQVDVDVPPVASPVSGIFYQWIIQTDRRMYRLPRDWRSWALLVPADGLLWPRSRERGAGRALLAVPVVTRGGDPLARLRGDADGEAAPVRLASFDADRQVWRMGEDVDPPAIGRGFAVTWSDGAPMVQVAAGRTVQLDTSCQIRLEPQWNLIGQPFPYSVSWSDVLAANPDLPIIGPWVERRGLRMADVWDAWEGAWVYLNSRRSRTLEVPARDASPGGHITKVGRPGVPAHIRRMNGWQTDMACLLAISVESQARSLHDLALGWHDRARDQFDRFDAPVPPTFDSSLVVRFLHADWDDNPGAYAIDIRHTGHGSIWRIAVDMTRGAAATMRLNFLTPPPSGMVADLIDLMTQDSLRLGTTSTFRLRDGGRFPLRELAVVIGDEAYQRAVRQDKVLAPSQVLLFQNYPNPFNGETTISFSIPSQATDADRVRLVVYNMLGQPVRVLYDGPAIVGVHTVPWNARNDVGGSLSSGLYFAELTWRDHRRLQRMIYLR